MRITTPGEKFRTDSSSCFRTSGGLPDAGLQVGFQPRFQGFAGPMDQRLGRGKRTPQHLGNVLICHVFVAAEQQRRPLTLRKIVERFLNALFQFALECPVPRRRRLVVLPLPGRCVILRGPGLQSLGGMPAPAPDFVQAEIPCDREEPGREASGCLIAPGGFIDLNEDGLG